MKKSLLIICALITIAASSCKQYKKTKTGLQYKVYGNDKGKKLAEGGFVKFNLVKKWKDSVYVSTYGGLPGYMPVAKGRVSHDFFDIITQLRVGDSVMIIQNFDSLNKYQPGRFPPGAKKNDRLTTTLKILEYFDSLPPAMSDYNRETAILLNRENVKVEEYLKKNNIPAVKSPKGIYVQVLKEGNGPKADSGKFASVWYTGKTLRGNTFDSNRDSTRHPNPQPWDLKVDEQSAIPGFVWGLEMLKQGGTGIIYIPPSAGYGKQGNPQVDIKGDDILTFEIEVVKVSDTMPAQKPLPTKL